MRPVLFAFLIVAGLAVPAAAEPMRFDGPLVQGGLVRGYAPPDARVEVDGTPVRVSPDGLFLVGFGRDAKPVRVEVKTGAGTEARVLEPDRRDYRIQRIDGLPPKQVTPDPETLKRIRAEGALIAGARKVDTAATDFTDGFAWPLQGRISGVFGSQRILNGEPRRPHVGVDIAAPPGTPVGAAAPGVVALVHDDMFYTGKTVMLDHGHGLSSIYVHMASIRVREGDRVRRGQTIGTVGRTGRATGPHLHWGVSLFATHLDPELLVGPMPAAE